MSKAKKLNVELSQQVEFLKKIAFFNDFDDNELLQFLNVSRWLKVPKNTKIIKENTSDRIFYILVKGKVTVYKTDLSTGRAVPLTSLRTGDCFGEMSLVSETKRTAGVITAGNCYILMVEPDIISTSSVFLQLKFYKRFCEILVSRLIVANERVVKETSPVQTADKQAKKEKIKNANPTIVESSVAIKTSEIKTADIKTADPEADAGKDLKSEPEDTESPETSEIPDQAEPENKEEEQVEEEFIIEFENPVSFDRNTINQELLPEILKKKGRISPVSRQRIRKKIAVDMDMAVNPVIINNLNLFLHKASENTRQFADLICMDPVLGAKVLQLANSSYFRRSCTVSSVAHAMITVGAQHIKETVEQAIEIGRHAELFSGYSQLTKAWWLHSVAVARVASLLKDAARINISTDIFMLGLLHDLGMVAVDDLEPDFYLQLMRTDFKLGSSLVEMENNYVGTEHGLAGSWLAEKMGLPSEFNDVMKYHHDPEEAKENIISVCLVHLADIFVSNTGICPFGLTECYSVNPLETKAWALLQENHKPFMEENVVEFVEKFTRDLCVSWKAIIADVL
jgi:HD-like signal output (HDOD) protein/CRP-like cAMP-binding protein